MNFLLTYLKRMTTNNKCLRIQSGRIGKYGQCECEIMVNASMRAGENNISFYATLNLQPIGYFNRKDILSFYAKLATTPIIKGLFCSVLSLHASKALLQRGRIVCQYVCLHMSTLD